MSTEQKWFDDYKNFVDGVFSDMLKAAKPNLIKAELVRGLDIKPSPYEFIIPEDDYVVITCENGHQYKVNVTADSKAAIVYDVMGEMMCR